MYRIPTILTSDELLDKAFKKASKVAVNDKNKFYRNKKLAISKLYSISDTIDATLIKYITKFPSFDNMSKFYYELIDINIGIDKLKKSLGALDWCRKNVRLVCIKKNRQIKPTANLSFIETQRKSAYGRVTSFVEQVSKDLLFLNYAGKVINQMPDIDPELKTIVIAGYPNVGKSQLVECLSSANPKVASYPFTTKEISIGHFEIRREIYQVIDTPGLLDRELSKRSDIEKKAITSLKYLADVIVYVIDPTLHCGFDLDVQMNLLSRVREMFEIPIIEVENKTDLKKSDSDKIKISSLKGDGIEELRDRIVLILEKQQREFKIS